MERQTYLIALDALSEARARIERLSARAERLGAAGPELIDTGERPVVRVERGGRSEPVEHARVMLTGEPPRLSGWRIVARLRHMGSDTAIDVLSESDFDPDRWSGAEPRCDHCGLRRQRVETYLLEHRSGRLAQVGSSCLRDFTGHDPGSALLQASCFADAARGLRVEAGGAPAAGDAGRAIAAADYLAHVAALAREREFTPASQAHAERPATAELAAENLRASRRGEATVRVEAQDRERAGAALAWVRGTLARKCRPSNYERRLVEVLCGGGLEPHELPLAASALLAHERAQHRESSPLGAPGERVEVARAFLERVTPGRDTRYGPSFAHSFRDQEGRRFVWFAARRQLVPGEHYRLRATVKRHDSPRGRAVTVLTRCRSEWLPREREARGG